MLSASVLEAIRTGDAVDVWTISAPDGSTWKWGPAGIRSKNFGFYENRIISYADVGGSVSVDGWRLQTKPTSFVASNEDGFISKFLESQYGRELSGSTAALSIIGPNVESGDEEVVFSGLLRTPTRAPGKDEYTFPVEPNTRALEGAIGVPAVTRTDHPQAPDASFDQPLPVIYGRVQSGIATNGAIQCVKLGDLTEGVSAWSITYPWRYSIGVGRIKGVLNEYADDVLVGLPDSARVIYEVRNGRVYTELGFATDQGDTKISVDVEGLTANADGSGALIEDPASQILHFARNFGFNTFDDSANGDGSYFTSGAFIEDAGFATAATYFQNRGITSAREVFSGQTFENVLSEWARNFRLPFIWTETGKLALGVDDHYLDPSGLNTWREGHEFDGKTFQPLYVDDLQRSEIEAAWSASRGDFQRTKVVREGLYQLGLPKAENFEWSSRE